MRILIDPVTGRPIVPSFGELVNTVLLHLRSWAARRQAVRVARVARELDALSDAELKKLGRSRAASAPR